MHSNVVRTIYKNATVMMITMTTTTTHDHEHDDKEKNYEVI